MTTAKLDYEHGRVGRLFGKVFFPTLLGMIFNTLLTIIDGVFIGRGVGPQGLAAVNVIAPLFMVSTGIGLMFGIGASVIAGIALASKDNARANSIITCAFLFSSIVMAGIVVYGLFFPTAFARVLGASDLLMPHARAYLLFLSIGLLPLMWQSIGLMVIRLDGSPKYAMMCNVIPATLNIFLDWLMIFPLGMGVGGAALATSISCVIGGVMAVVYFRWSYVLKFTRRITDFRNTIWNEVRIGSSAFITELAMSIMMFTGNYIFMMSFGENGVAAYAVACYLFPLVFMINNAVAQSAQPIISINYGTSNLVRVRQALKISVWVALICGLIESSSIGLIARPIVGLFIPVSSEAGRLAVSGLPIFATAAIFFALNIALIGYYQSIGRGGLALSLTLLRGVVLLVPLFFLMPVLFPHWGVWGAIPVSELITSAVILLVFLRDGRKFISVETTGQPS